MTYYHFNHAQIDNKVSALEKPNYFIIPFWIKKTIERNKSNLVELLNKSNWLDQLPKADLIDLIYINQIPNGLYDTPNPSGSGVVLRNINDLTSFFLSSLFGKMDPEIRSLFTHLDMNREHVGYTFRSAFNSDKEDTEDYYDLSIIDNIIVITLLPNFYKMGKADDEKFVVEFVKKLYTLLPVSDVSTTSVFKTYLKSLGKKED